MRYLNGELSERLDSFTLYIVEATSFTFIQIFRLNKKSGKFEK